MRKAWMLAPLAVVAVLVGASLSHAATGGPDGGGYTYIDSASAGGPVFAFNNISTTGTLAPNTSSCDDCIDSSIPIGFSFNFYGVNYTTINVSSNGNAQFTSTNAVFSNSAIPNGSLGPAVAPWFDDLWTLCDSIDRVVYQTVGSPGFRRFIIQWDAIFHISQSCTGDPDRITFQAILLEGTNEVLFQYLDATIPSNVGLSNGASATVGIQASSTIGLQYSLNQASLSDGLAICFRPPGATGTSCGAPPTPTPTATATQQATAAPTERPRVNVGGAVGAVAAAAGAQSRENRAAAAGTPTVPAQVTAPNTGTGITGANTGTGVAIAPPNTGDGGLASNAGNGVATAVFLMMSGFLLALVAGFSRRKRL